MEKLKPCPFCGNFSGYIVHQPKGMWKVSCSHGCVEQSAWFFTKDAARKAWNRRRGEWIPCKERVPETGAQVLVTIKWADDDFEVTLGEYWGKVKDEAERGWGGEINDKVIAWRPLPEPYEGDAYGKA